MADKKEPTVKFNADISELKKNIQDAKRSIREANAQFKKDTAGLESWEKSTDGLAAKLRQLDSTMKQEKSILADLQKQHELVAKAEGEDSVGAQNLRIKILQQEAAIGKTEKETKKYQQDLEDLKKGTEEAERAGEGWQKGLQKVEQNSKKAEKAADSYEKELKEVGDASEDAGKKTGWLKDKLAGLAKGAAIGLGKAAVGGIAAAGAAVVALGKKSLESYAEYEQLVGGVDTLFKKSSKTVQKYAANAYKTAGLSANEYMETVTSFSASLLQGLGGNTKKAAKYADVAITDMSDNANKMGTSMESIQNAYQGFAKQNYTMLDNLKLGYGGTKSEMARLVKDSGILGDAAKDLTAKNLDEKVSFDQIIQAIHKVQGRMGITGTTAKEASETIEGSVNSMKTAWGNLVTGLADNNADMGLLINNFVDSAITAGKNVLPRVETITEGIGTLVEKGSQKLLPKIIKGIPGLTKKLMPVLIKTTENLFKTILDMIPALLPVLMQALTQITSMMIGLLPQIHDIGMRFMIELFGGLANAVPQLLPQLTDALLQIVDVTIKNAPLLLNAGIQLFMGLVDAIPVVLQKLITALPQIIQSIFQVLREAIPKLLQVAIELFHKIVEAIPQIVQLLTQNLPQIINTIIDGLMQALPLVLDAAIQLLMMIVEAIPDIIVMLAEALPDVIDTIITFMSENGDKIFETALKMLGAILKAIPKIVVSLGKSMPKILAAIINALKKLPPKLITLQTQIFGKFTLFLLKVIAKIVSWGADLGRKGIEAAGKLKDAIVKGIKELPGKMKEIGGHIVKGIWNGIKGAGGWLKGKIKGFGKSVLKGVQGVFKIKSPSRVMRDQVGKYLAQGIAVGLEKYAPSVNKAASKLSKDLVKSLQTKAAKALSEELDKQVKKISDKAKKSIEAVKNKISTMRTKMSDYGDLYTKSDSGEIMLSDIGAQTKTLKTYAKNLKKLKGKVSSSLMAEIADMDIDDAIGYTDKLLTMSSSELEAYNKAYTEKLKYSKKTANSFYASELKDIKKNYADKMEEVFKKAKKQIKNLGVQAMKGFLKGMKGADSKGEIEKLVNQIVKKMRKELKINSPSKVFEQLGMYSAAGYNIGFRDTIKKAKGTILDDYAEKLGTGSGGSSSTQISNHYEFNQTNNSPKALSRWEIYRQSKNLLKGAEMNV